MIAVFVTFRFGEDFSAANVRQLAQSSRAKFEGMPGLRSKLFSVLPELREARNLYVWDDPEAAAFPTSQLPEDLEHEIHRRLRREPQISEPGLLGQAAQPRFSCLRAEAQADLLG